MYETQYLIVTALGTLSLVFALGLYRWHDEVELFAGISLVCWAVLVFESDNLVVITDSGTTIRQSSFSMQLLCLALALVSILAIYGARKSKWLEDSESRQEAPV